jgi:membrane protein DedA with SNARE-associated domain
LIGFDLAAAGVAVVVAGERHTANPSEFVLPLAGFRARSGSMNPFLVWIAATMGALAGAPVLSRARP